MPYFDQWSELVGPNAESLPTLGEGTMQGLGKVDYTELFQPKPVGEQVNVHVTVDVREPAPDYAAMQRLIVGIDKPVVEVTEKK